jgi:hypothetical protein
LRCPDELDTYLAALATPNWLSSYGDGMFAPKIGYCQEAQFEGEHVAGSIRGVLVFEPAAMSVFVWECRHGPA